MEASTTLIRHELDQPKPSGENLGADGPEQLRHEVAQYGGRVMTKHEDTRYASRPGSLLSKGAGELAAKASVEGMGV